MITPKQTFLADTKRAGAWHETTGSPLFRDAVHMALLQYASRLVKPNAEGPTLAVVGLRLQGAQEVLEELMNLGRQTLPQQQEDDDMLKPV